MASSALNHSFQLVPLSTKSEIIQDLEAEVSIAALYGKFNLGEDLIRVISFKKNSVESSGQSTWRHRNLTIADKLHMLHYIDKDLSANQIVRKFYTSPRSARRVRSELREILELEATFATLFIRWPMKAQHPAIEHAVVEFCAFLRFQRLSLSLFIVQQRSRITANDLSLREF